MHINGTDKIKGVLTIPSIGGEINKKTRKYPLDSSQQYNSDVQMAKQMKFIEIVEDEKEKVDSMVEDFEFSEELESEEKERVFKCRSNKNNKSTLMFSFMNSSVPPGGVFFLTETQLNEKSVTVAKAKKLFYVEECVGGEKFEESSLEIMEEETDEEELPEIELTETIDSEKPSVRVQDVVKNKNKLINPSDSEDPRKHSVVVDPNKESDKKEVKNAIVWDKTKKKTSAKKKNNNEESLTEEENTKPKKTREKKTTTKNKSIKRVGKAPKSYSDDNSEIDEVEFADHKEVEEKIKAHPVLKNQAVQNSEVDFVDLQ